MYDYGPHSGPESPHEMTHQQQQDRQERDYFEKIYATTEQHPSEIMQLHVQKQQHQRQKEGENDVRWEWERLRLQQQQQQQQREWERGRGRDWDWERDKNKQRDQQRFVSLPPPPPPATFSVEPAFDIDSLTSSLAAMSARLASSSASASTSASHSNSNSNPHSNSPSKPPSTNPMGMSMSTSSLPPGLGSGLPAVGNNLERYDRQYSHQQMHLPSMDTRTSSDSEPLMSKMMAYEVDSVLTDSSSSSPFLSVAQTHAQAQGIYGTDLSSSSTSAESDMSLLGSGASSGYGSGRVSRSSQGWDGRSVGGSGRVSRAEEKEAGKVVTSVEQRVENTWERQEQGYDSCSTSQEQAQIQQRPKQVPYHPGPISIPPMTFNPMQMPMGMIMPLTTMTPGHAHMAHAMMGMMNSNMSPLYHPAAAAVAAMGGGPSSPYRMYPTAPGSPPAVPGMITLTPHGLPPITPSMPPFNFLPPPHLQQQLYSVAEGQGRGGGSSEGRKSEGGRTSTSRVEGGCGACNSSSSVQGSTSGQPLSQEQQQQQQQRAYPLRLNLATAAGGFSPAMTMSPGTFYGRPGEVPGPNPYINAAVGAPVHPVSHPAMHSPPVHPHPPHHHPHHPSSLYHGTPQGVYYYSAMASPSKTPMTGMEPQGYFDPMYFPVNRTGHGDGGEGSAVSGGGGSFEREDNEEVKEVASPLPEGPGDPSSSSDDEGEDDTEHGEKSEADGVPSRTRSVGHSRDPSCLPGGEKLTTHGHGRGVIHRSGSDPGKP